MDDYKDKHKGAQKLYVSDDKGNTTGEIVERWIAHSGKGVKHLAIEVLVLNGKNEFVLHKRPVRKVGGGLLDTPVSHILEGETHEQAINRMLKEEYGITVRNLEHFGGFSYEKQYSDGTCENEFLLVSIAKYNGEFKPNPKEVIGGLTFLPAKNALKEVTHFPEKYEVWFKKSIEFLAKNPRAKKYVS
jgi:isopentenyldiphosphate isomerase